MRHILNHKNMSTENFVFKILQIIAWIIFIGLCIEAGGYIVNFVMSIFNPEMIPNLYNSLDLSSVYNQNQWAFFGIYSFIIFIAVLKAYLFYIVIRLLGKLDLTKPFNNFVAEQIMQLSYYTFSIGLLSYIARETSENLRYYQYSTENLDAFWSDAQAFILMSAVIYVIAVIFKKGVEMQIENDLTV